MSLDIICLRFNCNDSFPYMKKAIVFQNLGDGLDFQKSFTYDEGWFKAIVMRILQLFFLKLLVQLCLNTEMATPIFILACNNIY